MNKRQFLFNFILLHLMQFLLNCQSCHEEKRNIELLNCDNETNIIKGWIQKVLSKEYFKEDFKLTKIHTCQDDILSEAQVCSWGECGAGHTGAGSITLSGGRVVTGSWTRGRLSGWVRRAQGTEGSYSYYHNGCPQHSLVTRETEDWTLVASHDPASGLVSGPAWLLYSNEEGVLYTLVSEDNAASGLNLALFTGDNVTWLYPDLGTSLTGHFVAGTMLSAVRGEVSEVTMSDIGIPEIKMRESKDSEVYKFDPSTDVHLSSSPRVRDPYEKELLEVRKSSVPGAGSGVFARRSLANNTIVGYFNGVDLDREEVLGSGGEKSVYLVEGTWEGEMLDIPEEFQTWSNYQASTGHLINHSADSNVDYMECRHPRQGWILYNGIN